MFNVNSMIERGTIEMNAIEFVIKLRAEHKVLQNINGYLFGVQAVTLAAKTDGKQS